MMVDFAPRHIIDFPGQGPRPRHVNFALRVEQVRLDQPVRWIHQSHSIGDKGVTVIVGTQWTCGCAPDTLIVALHCNRSSLPFQPERD